MNRCSGQDRPGSEAVARSPTRRNSTGAGAPPDPVPPARRDVYQIWTL